MNGRQEQRQRQASRRLWRVRVARVFVQPLGWRLVIGDERSRARSRVV